MTFTYQHQNMYVTSWLNPCPKYWQRLKSLIVCACDRKDVLIPIHRYVKMLTDHRLVRLIMNFLNLQQQPSSLFNMNMFSVNLYFN